MRVLWIKSDVLLPLDTGGKLRTWHLLRNLTSRHEITYLGFANADQRREHIDGMSAVARDVHVVPRVNTAKGSLRFYADAALHLLDPLPYAIGKYRSRAFRARVDDLLRTRSFDLIVCDFLVPAVNLPLRLPCPSVLFTHNVEAEIWRRHAETKRGRVARRLYDAQHRRMSRFEARTLARFDGVLAVSDADRDTFARLYPGAIREPVHVIATGVDTDFFVPAAGRSDSRSLVFTGSMDWLPNEDAMLFFCREVLPLIRNDQPDVTLSIVGRTPTPAVAQLSQQAGIVVTGRVEDVRPHIADAAVYVVPLRIGGGTRLKIFEAMSMGKAVVSTTIGAEGLPVIDGEHLMLADGPKAFADAVVRLLRDVERRRALEAAARTLVVEHYDWSAVAGELDRALTQVARRDAAAPSARCAKRRRTRRCGLAPSNPMSRTDCARPPVWPDGASFAFTVFDDPDAQTYEDGRVIYSYLAELGFKTTRGVWPGAAVRTPNSPGETCERADYRQHSVALQEQGFEIGYHHTTKHSSTRDEIRRGLDAFREYFGHDPQTMANHYNAEAIYWGSRRITPPLRAIYAAATLGRTNGRHFGEVEGHPSFWGDLCRERIQYCRNFVFSDVDTLAACPWMPYRDPLRPYVNEWYASAEGSNVSRFTAMIAERNQDRLEEQGGACIMYTHFGHGFVERGRLHARFRSLMERLSRKNGWFVPVGVLLDYLRQRRDGAEITDRQRRSLEQRWLWQKMFRGTS